MKQIFNKPISKQPEPNTKPGWLLWEQQDCDVAVFPLLLSEPPVLKLTSLNRQCYTHFAGRAGRLSLPWQGFSRCIFQKICCLEQCLEAALSSAITVSSLSLLLTAFHLLLGLFLVLTVAEAWSLVSVRIFLEREH